VGQENGNSKFLIDHFQGLESSFTKLYEIVKFYGLPVPTTLQVPILKIPGSVKAFEFLLKISPVKISETNSCPLRDGNHLGLTRPNLR
jgi:hypothetical protein